MCVSSQRRGVEKGVIPVTVLINCFWRNEICYTNALLLLLWPIFVAQKQLIINSTGVPRS